MKLSWIIRLRWKCSGKHHHKREINGEPLGEMVQLLWHPRSHQKMFSQIVLSTYSINICSVPGPELGDEGTLWWQREPRSCPHRVRSPVTLKLSSTWFSLVSLFCFVCLFGVVLGLCHGALASLFQSMSGMWDFSSLTRDQIYIHCIGRWILNHWTTREVSALASLNPSV